MASVSVLDAFESAKREFLLKYPNGNTYDFTSFPTVDHVYQAAQQIQEQQAKTRSMRNLNKIRPLLETLKHYGNVVDTFVQVKPDVLALIWGPIKFLLLISSTFDSIFDKIVDAMEQIGISLPAFQQYTQLFPNNNKIHQALCLFYQDILDFYASMLDAFKHNKWSTLFKSLWPRYLGRIQVIQRNMSQHRNLMNDEATLAHLVQAQADRERALEEYEHQFEFRQLQEFDMVRSSLNARLYDQDLESLKARASRGSGNWLEDHVAYRKWMDVQDKSSRLLWLQGIPGAGKTYLSSFVIQNAQARSLPVAFIFLDYRFRQEASTLKILHSVTTQFILDNKRLRHLMISAHHDNYRQFNCSIDFMKGLLKNTLDCLSNPFIVIDGLDEMDEQERTVLLQTIHTIVEQNKELRILLSSRPEDDVVRFMEARQTSSIRVHDVNHLDIETYVDSRALQLISELSTSSTQSDMIRKLMQKVALNAQGMFLYARLLCDMLVRNGDIADLKVAVDNLPEGLNEAYGRVLDAIEKLTERERHESRQILSLIASSAGPLTGNEIQLAVFTARTGDACRGIESLFLNIMRRCGPIVEERSGYVQFVHFTVYEYLLGSQSDYYLESPQTHALISEMSMTYLKSTCFDPNISDDALKQHVLSGAYVLENYVCIHWLDHLRNAESVFSDDQVELSSSLIMERSNPTYSGEHASDAVQSQFLFLGDCSADFANAFEFSRRRKRDICFIEGGLYLFRSRCLQFKQGLHLPDQDKIIQNLDPFTFTMTQLRVRSTLESVLCNTARHQENCSCSTLKGFYGEGIYKCGRPGCPYFRIGFATKGLRKRHMQAHSRPFKCDISNCDFSDLGFATQALLTTHYVQFHSQPSVKSGSQRRMRTKKQELKLILIDMVKEDDVQTLLDMWDVAKTFGSKLLLTAIQEQSSDEMLAFLIERVPYARFPIQLDDTPRLVKHKPGALKRIFLAALNAGNCEVFRTFNIQQFCHSFSGEKVMSNVIAEVAAKRNPEIVEIVLRQLTPFHIEELFSRIIPFRPNAVEEMSALKCLERIAPQMRRFEMADAALRETASRCCSLLLAKFLIKEGAKPNGDTSFNGHTPIFAASGKSTRESAEFIKYLFDKGANMNAQYLKQKPSDRPAAKTFKKWIGVTWDELAATQIPSPSRMADDGGPSTVGNGSMGLA